VKGDSGVAKATLFILVLIAIAMVNLVLILKELKLGFNPFKALDPLKREISSLVSNFNYALHLVKESSRLTPGSGKLILFLIMILLLAIPIEILASIRRR